MAAEIHKYDIGTKFLRTMYDEQGSIVDISSASTKIMRFKKPNGVVVEKDTIFETDGTDGQLYYTTILNDLDQAGQWYLQVFVVLYNGQWYSDVSSFIVHDNLFMVAEAQTNTLGATINTIGVEVV